MFEPEELMARIEDLESQLKVSEMATPAAEQLIACLEGEIAKRDARIVELEDDLKCAHSMLAEVSKAGMALRAELAAIKAQEPVAARVRFRHPQKTMPDWSVWQQTNVKPNAPAWTIDGAGYEVEYQPLYAAPVSEATITSLVDDLRIDAEAFGLSVEVVQVDTPVSEAKAQGVVMPERQDDQYGDQDAIGWNACLDEVARLNATPVQQVSVPGGWKLVPVEPTKAMLFACEDAGSIHNQQRGKRIYNAMLAAAPAAPAADAGLVEALCHISLCSNNSMSSKADCGKIARAALAAHRAKGAV